MTLGKRVAGGFVAVIAVALALAAVAYSRFLAISDAGEYLATDPVPGTIAILELSKGISDNSRIICQLATATDKAKVLADFDRNRQVVNAAMQRYDATITEADDRAMFEELAKARAGFLEAAQIVVAAVNAGRVNDATAAVDAKVIPAYTELARQVDHMVEFNEHNLSGGVARIHRTAADGRRALLVGMVLATMVASLVAYVIVRTTSRAMHKLSEGLASGADQVACAAGQVAATSEVLAQGAAEQAASLEESSAALEELASMTKRNAESTRTAKETATQSRVLAESGLTKVEALQRAMAEIESAGSDISKILGTIDEIAFQTNILALNAAVEAARAGESGAGFAVVADEVRALAHRCADAAKETAAKIDRSVEKSAQGSEISSEVAKAFKAIEEHIHTLDGVVGDISSASSEQNQGLAQVTQAITDIDRITQTNAANAEEAASAAEELNGQATAMREGVTSLQLLVGGAASRAEPPSHQVRPTAPARSVPATPPNAPRRRQFKFQPEALAAAHRAG